MKKQAMALTVLVASLAGAQANANCSDNCAMSIGASALTTFAPAIITGATTEGLTSRKSHDKLIAAAQEDAQAYVSSDGQIYGVQLASAIEVLRADLPHLVQANDMQIALAILGQ